MLAADHGGVAGGNDGLLGRHVFQGVHESLDGGGGQREQLQHERRFGRIAVEAWFLLQAQNHGGDGVFLALRVDDGIDSDVDFVVGALIGSAHQVPPERQLELPVKLHVFGHGHFDGHRAYGGVDLAQEDDGNLLPAREEFLDLVAGLLGFGGCRNIGEEQELVDVVVGLLVRLRAGAAVPNGAVTNGVGGQLSIGTVKCRHVLGIDPGYPVLQSRCRGLGLLLGVGGCGLVGGLFLFVLLIKALQALAGAAVGCGQLIFQQQGLLNGGPRPSAGALAAGRDYFDRRVFFLGQANHMDDIEPAQDNGAHHNQDHPEPQGRFALGIGSRE